MVEGNSAKLVCKVKGKPEPVIEWTKDGKPVKENNRINIHFDGETSTLKFTETRADDEGDYKCTARNNLGTTTCTAELLVNEASVSPEFKYKLVPVEALPGSEARFNVRVIGTPAPVVDWFKGKDRIEDEGRFMIVDDEEDDLFSLIIDDILREDAGTYTCVASNEKGEATCKAPLTITEKLIAPEIADGTETAPVDELQDEDASLGANIKGAPTSEITWHRGRKSIVETDLVKPAGEVPELAKPLESVEVKEGKPAKLECKIFGKPKPTIEWFKDDLLIKESRRVKTDFLADIVTLRISRVEPGDKGVYKCVARNEAGTVSTTGELLIEEPDKRPEFIAKIKPFEVSEGEVARFEVRLRGKPVPDVDWFRGTTKIKDGGGFNMTSDKDQGLFSLVIDDAKLDDAGTYKCTARNREGETTSRGALSVKEKIVKPEFDGEEPGPIEVREGEDLTIDIHVKGKPIPSVTWFKDDRRVSKTSRLDFYSKGNKFLLVVLRIKPEDAGTYKCTATSNIGTATRFYIVRVSRKNYFSTRCTNGRSETKTLLQLWLLRDGLWLMQLSIHTAILISPSSISFPVGVRVMYCTLVSLSFYFRWRIYYGIVLYQCRYSPVPPRRSQPLLHCINAPTYTPYSRRHFRFKGQRIKIFPSTRLFSYYFSCFSSFTCGLKATPTGEKQYVFKRKRIRVDGVLVSLKYC